MRSSFLVVVLLLCSFSGATNPAGERRFGLEPRKSTDKTRIVDGSSLYFADSVNRGRTPEKIEAVKMPEGYAEGGTFFACSVEGWNNAEQRWVSIWAAKLSDFGHRRPLEVEIRSGETLQVCGLYLPLKAGAKGQCVRFRLRPNWQHSRESFVSKPFLIDDEQTAQPTPCH